MPKATSYEIDGYHHPSTCHFKLVYEVANVNEYLEEIGATIAESTGDYILLMQEVNDPALSAILVNAVKGQKHTFTAIDMEVDETPVPHHYYEWDSVRLTTSQPFPRFGEDDILVMHGLEGPHHLMGLLNEYEELLLAANFIGPLRPRVNTFCRSFKLRNRMYILFETYEKLKPTVHLFQLRTPNKGSTWAIHPVRFVPEQT